MPDNKLPFALSFERQYAGPIDPTEVFATIAERDAYLNNATRYPGQQVTCLEVPGKIFVLSNDKSAWLVAGGDAPKPIVFETDAEMQAYLTNDKRYAGQVVTCLETIDKQYILSADMLYWEVAGCGIEHTHDVSQILQYDTDTGQYVNLGDRLSVMFEIDRYLSNMSESNTQLYIEDIAMLAGVLTAHSQAMSNIASGLHGYSVPELEATDITGSEDIMIRQEGTFVTVKTDLLKQYILRDMGGIYRWTDSGEDQILGAAWTLEGTLVGDKFDIVIRMAVSPVTGSSVDSLEIRPLAQFAGMRVHSKFLECIVTESTDAGSGTMGLLVYHFYQNNQHAYANHMSSLNEINESCYISNYNDTQSSSYYYSSGVLADANDIVFAFNGDGYWETRPVRRVKEYHYSGILLGTITPTEIPA